MVRGFPASKVVWLRKFWASRREAKRSLLEVNEHLTHNGSAEITNHTTISHKKEIWCGDFGASGRKRSRSLLIVNEAHSFEGSAKITHQIFFFKVG